jgi:hypothetical protein
MVISGGLRDTWLLVVGGVTHGYDWWVGYHTATSGGWRGTWLLVVVGVTRLLVVGGVTHGC